MLNRFPGRSPLARAKPGLIGDKGPHIGVFLNDLVRRLACPVARPRLNPDEMRFFADIGGLERGRIFEGMAGHHPIVSICRGHKDRRIIRPVPDIVIG